MEVRVISRENIRPSSPKPSNLRTFKLCFFDQVVPLIYVPVIFHYPTTDASRDINQVLDRLKKSLSEALSLFYPLAGRIKDHLSIDCNDEGVLFIEAQVNCHMSEFLKQPEIDLLHRLVPCVAAVGTEPENTLVQVAVQVNVFISGGIAMGVCVLHKIIDGGTLSAFLKCWAAMASGYCNDDKAAINPNFTAGSSFFPPREQLPQGPFLFRRSWLKEGKSVHRRFVFNSAAITALRAKATSQTVPDPSRVEAVAGFIWKCAMTATRRVTGSQRASLLAVAMNLRPRMVPPLSEYAFGNITWRAMAHRNAAAAPIDETGLLQVVVGLMREAIAKVDSDYVRSLQGEKGFHQICKIEEELYELHSREKSDFFMLSSLKTYAFTELDFGWGKPIWVSHVRGTDSPLFANQIILEETQWDEKGIEAWLVLGEHEMAILEHDPQLLSFASLNPTIPLPVARL